MANTTTISGNVAAQWSKDFMRYGRHNMFFSKFIGKTRISDGGVDKSEAVIASDPNAMIQLRMEMTKAAGDGITYPLIAPLSGHGRVGIVGTLGQAALEGYEEGVLNYAYKIALAQWGHAVRDTGPLTRQIAAFDWDSTSKMALSEWYSWALDKATYSAMAGLAFVGDQAAGTHTGTTLVARATPTRKLTGGMRASTSVFTARTTDAAVEADEFMCLEMISEARRQAIATEPIIRPIIIDGQPWYLMFLSPLQTKALKTNQGKGAGNTWAAIQKDANIRGSSNPLFTAALGEWDGVLLYEYARIGDYGSRTGTAGQGDGEAFDLGDPCKNGSKVNRALFCGAGAAVHAYGAAPKFVGEDFSYEQEHGISVQMIVGVGKPKFTVAAGATDYGCMCVDSAVA